jgi:hypothetical protein
VLLQQKQHLRFQVPWARALADQPLLPQRPRLLEVSQTPRTDRFWARGDEEVSCAPNTSMPASFAQPYGLLFLIIEFAQVDTHLQGFDNCTSVGDASVVRPSKARHAWMGVVMVDDPLTGWFS